MAEIRKWHKFTGKNNESYNSFHGFVTFRDARYHIRIKAEMVCNQKINGQVIPVQITENNVLEKKLPCRHIAQFIGSALEEILEEASQEAEKGQIKENKPWTQLRNFSIPFSTD